jgi:hypothetical protein
MSSKPEAAPPAVVAAVVKLALACAEHKLLLKEIPQAEVIAKQARTIERQRQLIDHYEKQLGISDEL